MNKDIHDQLETLVTAASEAVGALQDFLAANPVAVDSAASTDPSASQVADSAAA
jgi:hypothetical protein